MGIRRRGEGNDDGTAPASESIDEALARLARQDHHLNPVSPQAPTARAVGPRRVTRDLIWVVARWAIIIVGAWLVWRLARSA
jgi:hypothetical protein